MALFNCKVGSTENIDFSNFTVTTINRDGSKTQTINCEIGDIIIVGTIDTQGSLATNPTFVSGATLIEEQSYQGTKRGLIGKATNTSVTIEWYGASSNGIIRVIHTPYLRNSSYTIERSNAATSISSKNITGLKVGDIIVGNTGNVESSYDSIRTLINGAPIIDSNQLGACYVAVKDEVPITLSGPALSYTVVAIRQ